MLAAYVPDTARPTWLPASNVRSVEEMALD